MNIGIISAWRIERDNESYYIPSVHYSYLEYVSKLYDKVYLVSPHFSSNAHSTGFTRIELANVSFVPITPFGNYLTAQFKWREYKNAIRSVMDKVDLFYCRVPDPFSWMPALFTNKPVTMHFVGDTIDATKYNEKWSWLKKKIMIAGYLPDYWLTLKAARKSRVYTNGYHLADRLAKYRVKASPVISSIVKEGDLSDDFHSLSSGLVRLSYVGYLRYAKGMNTIMATILKLEEKKKPYRFNIVGSGEMYNELLDFINVNNLSDKVILHGHVDNRSKLNKILKQTDLFFFPSLSEGSPRVVIEAMSQGVPVMSTPVGSVPHVFKDQEEIRLFDFNNVQEAIAIIEQFLLDNGPFIRQRVSAFNKVKKNYTLESFLSKVFSYEA